MIPQEDTSRSDDSPADGRFSWLKALSEYIVAVTVALYVVGFLITGSYLSSLGVFNFDLLRVRYIVNGFLFTIFALAILSFEYGLRNWYCNTRNDDVWDRIFSLASLFVYSYLFILFLSYVLSAFGASYDAHYFFKADLLGSWCRNFLMGATNGLRHRDSNTKAVIVVLVFIPIFMMSRELRVRRDRIKDYGFYRWHDVLQGTARGWIGLIILITSIGLYSSFVSSNYPRKGGLSVVHPSYYGWEIFQNSLLLIYGVSTIFVVGLLVFGDYWKILIGIDDEQRSLFVGGSRNDSPYLIFSRPVRYAILVALSVLIIPVYSVGVYPYMPQQIGGGSVVLVEPSFSSKSIEKDFSRPGRVTYLVDRTSSSVIFLLWDRASGRGHIEEVDSRHIESISYGQR